MLSILEVYSASSNMSYKSGEFWMPMITHSVFVIASVFTAYLISKTHIVFIKIGLVALYALTLVLLPLAMLIGPSLNETNRWLKFAGFTFQPSEFAKLSIVGVVAFLFAAGYSKKISSVKPKWFYAAVAATAFPAILICLDNFSTAVIIGLVMILLAGIANPPRKIYWPMCSTLLVIALSGYLGLKNMPGSWTKEISELPGLKRFPTWVKRIQTSEERPTDPKKYDVYANWQTAHSSIAVATSGLVGCGLGHSTQRDYLPHAYSDYIYAIVIEECGWIIAILVMLLYLVLLYRCIKIADDCKTRYARFLVMGLAMMITTQAMINMAVAVGAMPVTGQPLPLMSKGGTSMIVTGAYIGIILSVSRTVKKRKEKLQLEQANTTEE